MGLRSVKSRVAFDSVVEEEGWPPELEWVPCIHLIHDYLTAATSSTPYMDMRLPSSKRKSMLRYFLRDRPKIIPVPTTNEKQKSAVESLAMVRHPLQSSTMTLGGTIG
jgi:hypothetical protein